MGKWSKGCSLLNEWVILDLSYFEAKKTRNWYNFIWECQHSPVWLENKENRMLKLKGLVNLVLVLTIVGSVLDVSKGYSSTEGKETDKATFAGGCFWCMEEAFEPVEGVVSVVSGYTGGQVENPTYEQVLLVAPDTRNP